MAAKMTAAEHRAEAERLEQEAKKPVAEFSKVMIKTYSWACIVWITASYALAAFGKAVNDGVTMAVVGSLAAVLLGYFMKSWKENVNKNKKGGG